MKFAIVMFLHVSVYPQGDVCPIACWDTHTPGQTFPWADTAPLDGHPPGQTPPWADNHPGQKPPRQTPPQADTPLGRHPSTLGRHTLPGQIPPPWADTPPPWTDTLLGRRPQPQPPAQCTLGYGQQAGGTHPTGMQSCLHKIALD